jgi:hypothetical protein
VTEDRKPAAEQIAALLKQLNEEVTTHESVVRYRSVKRGRGRDAMIADIAIHRTRRPGLIDQARAAAVPQGSPGWDEDGALSPMPSGGSFESQEPVTEAFHLPEEYAHTIADLVEEAAAAGYPGIIDAALADEHLGARFAARLRAIVNHARIVLKYDVPIVPLRDMRCPDCGGIMRVRKDASTPVWCSGLLPVAGPALPDGAWPIGWAQCEAKWPRWQWVKLLAEVTDEAS